MSLGLGLVAAGVTLQQHLARVVQAGQTGLGDLDQGQLGAIAQPSHLQALGPDRPPAAVRLGLDDLVLQPLERAHPRLGRQDGRLRHVLPRARRAGLALRVQLVPTTARRWPGYGQGAGAGQAPRHVERVPRQTALSAPETALPWPVAAGAPPFFLRGADHPLQPPYGAARGHSGAPLDARARPWRGEKGRPAVGFGRPGGRLRGRTMIRTLNGRAAVRLRQGGGYRKPSPKTALQAQHFRGFQRLAEGVRKTRGYCWRNHCKATRATHMSRYG